MITVEGFSAAIKRAASSAGFELSGIASLGNEEEFPELVAFCKWVEAGHAGEMKYLEKRDESGTLRRKSIKNSIPWARSVVICGLNYNSDKPYSIEVHDPERAWISRYAWGSQDYHVSLLKRLEQVEQSIRSLAREAGEIAQTRSYVDTGPIVERVYAKYAGVGWIGKNTCIINQQYGSWVFLGVILTSIELTPDLPAADRCGTCTRCIDACPTQAITAPGVLDARRCIAYLTIEKRGEVPPEFRSQLGHHVFGCDICQDVCPWNNKSRRTHLTQAAEFFPKEALFQPKLEDLAAMTEEQFNEAFRGSPVKRAKYAGFKRNVIIAMANSGNTQFIPRLQVLAHDKDPCVAEHARWALDTLSATPNKLSK